MVSEDDAPWSALAAEAREIRTPCGDGTMLWRVWGNGPPLVLLHGGAGSWLHWIRTIPAFVPHRLVLVPDLPGLGVSALPPTSDAAGIASIVGDGIDAVLGRSVSRDVVGFSYGGVLAGLVAARQRSSTRSLTLVGAGGLGIISGSAALERVRDKTGAEREAAHRTNLSRWMIAEPEAIDPLAVAIQDWNSQHARYDSRPVGTSDLLVHALPGIDAAVTGIWGARDHAVKAEPERARTVLQDLVPNAEFYIIPKAGHWVAYEAGEAFAHTLRGALTGATA
jgi:pimeloyl-ACP methyl ester carboxylesterase